MIAAPSQKFLEPRASTTSSPAVVSSQTATIAQSGALYYASLQKDTMDVSSPLANVDVSKLSDRDKQELQQFVMNESQKARIQSSIHSLTDTCFKKCIPGGAVKNGKLDKYEEPCMRQCVDRFLDANLVVLKELERLKGSM